MCRKSNGSFGENFEMNVRTKLERSKLTPAKLTVRTFEIVDHVVQYLFVPYYEIFSNFNLVSFRNAAAKVEVFHWKRKSTG